MEQKFIENNKKENENSGSSNLSQTSSTFGYNNVITKDILLIIFGFLELKDLLNSKLVCKTWYNLLVKKSLIDSIRDYPLQFEYISHNLFNSKLVNKIWRGVPINNSLTGSVQIYPLDFKNMANLVSGYEIQFRSLNSEPVVVIIGSGKVENVLFSGKFSVDGILKIEKWIIHFAPEFNIKKILFDNTEKKYRRKDIPTCSNIAEMGCFNSVQEIIFKNTDPDSYSKYNQNVQKITIIGNTGLTDGIWHPDSFPNLELVVLKNVVGMTVIPGNFEIKGENKFIPMKKNKSLEMDPDEYIYYLKYHKQQCIYEDPDNYSYDESDEEFYPYCLNLNNSDKDPTEEEKNT